MSSDPTYVTDPAECGTEDEGQETSLVQDVSYFIFTEKLNNYLCDLIKDI